MNNYRQPYYRSSGSCNASRQAAEPTRCGCQNIAAAEASCSCQPKPPTDCACDCNDMPGFALGMAFVPWQPWRNLYSTEQALWKGTLFQDLDLDFMGRRCN